MNKSIVLQLQDLRMNRSIHVEGAFGVIKENRKFRQFMLRGSKR